MRVYNKQCDWCKSVIVVEGVAISLWTPGRVGPKDLDFCDSECTKLWFDGGNFTEYCDANPKG